MFVSPVVTTPPLVPSFALSFQRTMDFVRTISRAGDKEEAEEEHPSFSSAAVVPVEGLHQDIHNNNNISSSNSSNPLTLHSPSNTNNPTNDNLLISNNHNHTEELPVVQENPTEREERTEEADSEASEEEDEDEYEYEDEDEAAFASFLVDQPHTHAFKDDRTDHADASPATIEEDEAPPPAAKWREPSREAVTMSLRAEQETSGSKRRLAQDLYRIMNKDTSETGFLLEPAVEDQMDKWKISLFQFDADSMLAKDLKVLGLHAVELEMSFPEQYPFSPPFVRVVRPRFKRQTGFVMNGALCMELLTNDGWNPVNDIESVIVSIRSLLVVGEGRLEAAANMSQAKYQAALQKANDDDDEPEKPDAKMAAKRLRTNSVGDAVATGYSVSEAKAAYEHLSSYHQKKGWDQSGWWARKG